MLRRQPTTITLTSEDVAAYEDARAARIQAAVENERLNDERQRSAPQPNPESKLRNGDTVSDTRTGSSRDQRIGISR